MFSHLSPNWVLRLPQLHPFGFCCHHVILQAHSSFCLSAPNPVLLTFHVTVCFSGLSITLLLFIQAQVHILNNTQYKWLLEGFGTATLCCELMLENIIAAPLSAAARLIGVWFTGRVWLVANLLDFEWVQHAAAAKSLQPKLSQWIFICSYYFPGAICLIVVFFFAPVGFFPPLHQDLLHHRHWSRPSEAQPAGGCDPFPHRRGAWPGMWVPGTKRALLGFSCTHHGAEGTVTNWLVSDWAPVAPAHTSRTKLKPRLIHMWKWTEVPLSCHHQRIFLFFFAFQSCHITQPYWRSQHRKYWKAKGLRGAWWGLHTTFKRDWPAGLEGVMAGGVRKAAVTTLLPRAPASILWGLHGAVQSDGFFRTRIVNSVFQTEPVTDLGKQMIQNDSLSCSPSCSSLSLGPILQTTCSHASSWYSSTTEWDLFQGTEVGSYAWELPTAI